MGGILARQILDISVLLFFDKDRVDKGEVSIKYCPTEYMLDDYFTKTLQGKVFCVFRRVIMGYKTISWIKQMLLLKKERVEKANKILVNRNINEKNKKDRKRVKIYTYADIFKCGSMRDKCIDENVVLTKLN